MPERLQKILSRAGVASRRLTESLILQGRVEVNGAVVTTLGAKADAASDEIKVDGRRLAKSAPTPRHILLYKPRGVVSTRVDPQRRPTVIDLLAKAGVRGYFYPVGRLDFESEGLMLLTNDGDFAERVAHPRYEIERTYEALVRGVPDARDLGRLEHGVVIDGRRTLPARVRLRGPRRATGEAEATIELVLREGRNRQVRRMCEAVGHPVVELRRTRLGPLTLQGLRPGQIRELTAAEMAALVAPKPRPGVGAAPRARRDRPRSSDPRP